MRIILPILTCIVLVASGASFACNSGTKPKCTDSLTEPSPELRIEEEEARRSLEQLRKEQQNLLQHPILRFPSPIWGDPARMERKVST
jgi:hypothetical protein